MQCRQLETSLPLIDMMALSSIEPTSKPLTFPHDVKAWTGPCSLLRTLQRLHITDWAEFDAKMNVLCSILLTKITPGKGEPHVLPVCASDHLLLASAVLICGISYGSWLC